MPCCRCVFHQVFQLTTSRRGRRCPPACCSPYSYFNSRPHEEVDFLAVSVLDTFSISTHDLTKRSTVSASSGCLELSYFNSRPHEEVDVRFPPMLRYGNNYFNSRPHEEVDRASGTLLKSWLYFNSRPHEEVDRKHCCRACRIRISTHDLTKRSTN